MKERNPFKRILPVSKVPPLRRVFMRLALHPLAFIFPLIVVAFLNAQAQTIDDNARIRPETLTTEEVLALAKAITSFGFQCETVTRVGPVHPAIGDFRVHCDRYRNEYIVKIQDDAFEVIVR